MYREKHGKYRRTRFMLRVLLAALILLIVIWPLAEPHMLQVEQTHLSSSALPADVGQLRIVFVTDIHQDGFPFFTQQQTAGLISRINSLNADLVLFGGDYTSSPEQAVAFFNALPAVHANYGAYGILGEHDRDLSGETLRELRAAMKAKGVALLVDEIAGIRVGNNEIYIAGLDDITSGSPKIGAVSAQVHRDDFVILLGHSPALIEEAMEKTDADKRKPWFDLGLFGHTHGGQCAVFGGLLHIADEVDSHYQMGWLEENRIPVLISSGIGTVGLPVRFLRRPVIHVITLRNGS